MQHQYRIGCVHVDKLRHPLVAVFLVRYRVDNGKPAVDAPLFAVPECRRSRGRMKPYLAANICIGGKRCEHAAIFQLVAARLTVLRDEPVILHKLTEPVQAARRADKSVEHAAGGKHIHRFLSPVAADLQLVQPLRQSDAEVHVAKLDMSFVIFVFRVVLVLVIGKHILQFNELLLFGYAQARHRADIQSYHRLTFIQFSSSATDLACRSSHPRVPGRRLPRVSCSRRRSRTLRRLGA